MAAAATRRVLYWGSGSPPAWRVAIALEEKQLAYDSRLLEFSKRASFQSWKPQLTMQAAQWRNNLS